MTDSVSGALSLIQVIEELGAEVLVPPGAPVPQDPTVPLSLSIVSLWERSSPGVPEDKESYQVRIIDPNGKEIARNEQVFSMIGPHVRSRNIMNVQGLPVNASGRYEFRVFEHRAAKWIQVAVVPVQLKVSARSADPAPARPS